jgi:GT2 family glycosyltransferase
MIDVIFPIYVCDEENNAIQSNCFKTLYETVDRQHLNIIIIDNGSIQSAADEARSVADIYIRTPRPIGYAKAVNIGWKLCEHDVIVVANNDLAFKKGWLEPLLIRVDCETVVAPCEAAFEGESDEVWSSCFVMRNLTRQKIGFFDDVHLPYRYHDQDYWIRAKKKGIAFKRLGSSVVSHRESTTFNKMEKREEYIKAEERVMIDRHGTTMAALFNIK